MWLIKAYISTLFQKEAIPYCSSARVLEPQVLSYWLQLDMTTWVYYKNQWTPKIHEINFGFWSHRIKFPEMNVGSLVPISEQRSARSTFDCIVRLAIPAAISETSPIFSNKIQGTLFTLSQKLTQQLTKRSMLIIKQLAESIRPTKGEVDHLSHAKR